MLFEPLLLGTIALQAGILVMGVEAVRRNDVPAIVNAVVVAIIVLSSIVFELWLVLRTGQVTPIGWELSFWLAITGCLHTFGMLGVYDSIWWWDHLTHTISAGIIAAVVYATLLVSVDRGIVALDGFGIAVATLLIAFLAGVFWELVELFAREVGTRFGVRPVLVHYGRRDTILDLVFDVVGAIVIVGFDVRLFVPVAAVNPGVASQLLGLGVVFLLVGTLLLTVIVLLSLQTSK